MNRFRLMSVVSALALTLVAAAPLRAADTYKIDPVHSTSIFRISHLGSSWIYGRFDDVTGTFTVDPKNAADVKFDVIIKADSIDTNNVKRDTHLKSADFFSVKEFPTIEFKSTQVKEDGEKKYDVTGDLTLHGVTKSVTAKVEFVGTADATAGARDWTAGLAHHDTAKTSAPATSTA